MSLTNSDLLKIDSLLTKRLTVELSPMRHDIAGLTKKFTILQTSVDKYLKRTEDWHVEFQVLDARVDRVRAALLKKGIATEEDLALLHK